MFKFIIVALASAMLCGIVYRFFPGTTAIAMSPAGFSISWLALVGVAGVVLSYKFLGK